MILYQFNALDEWTKAEMVWNGAFVGKRKDEEHDILLYQVDSFYVEVYYHRANNCISHLRPFSSTDQLSPYLQQIDISSML